MSVGIQWAHTVSMWPLGPAVPRGRLYPLKESFGLRLLLMHLVLSPLGLDGTLHAQEAGLSMQQFSEACLTTLPGSSRQHRARGTASGAGLGQ